MNMLSNLLKRRKEEEAAKQKKERQEELSHFIQAPGIKNSINEPLFFAVYSTLIRHPYELNILAFREYREFVLGTEQYVLNTFYQLDQQRIMDCYLQRLTIKEPHHLYGLYMVITELHLCVPSLYQTHIEELILSL